MSKLVMHDKVFKTLMTRVLKGEAFSFFREVTCTSERRHAWLVTLTNPLTSRVAQRMQLI